MEEEETSLDELEVDLETTKQQIEKNQARPRAQAEAREKLKGLEFIKCVSYALLQTQQKLINN